MKFIWLGFVLGFTCFIIGVYLWFSSSLKPISNQSNPKVFIVNPGDPANLVLKNLKSQNFIKNYYVARIYYQFVAKNMVFRPGVYYLSADKSVAETLKIVSIGPKDIKITFPEGWRREQYAARLNVTFPGFDTGEFLKLTATLEGRLFPDTYYLPASPSPQKVVSILISNFANKTKLDLSNSQTLILASLVERESNNPNDSKIIAGILLKRLKNNWPLQIDATVQYAKDTQNCQKTYLTCDYWKPIYDTKFISAYNTYLNPGLPPTPIASPGLASIQAVINPQDSEYWYYLTGNNHQTYYAKDLATHQKHIDSYLKP